MLKSTTSSKPGMEHRWGERRQVILRVWLNGPGNAASGGWLTDISLSGAYVRTVTRLPVMSDVSIEVDQRDDANSYRLLQLKGRIVRHGPTGLGLEWEEFASGMQAELVRIGTLVRWHRDQTPDGVPHPDLWPLMTEETRYDQGYH